MLIRLGYEFVFQVPARTSTMVMLYVHPSQAISLLEADRVHVEPDLPVREFIDAFGNRCSWLVAPAGKLRLWNRTLIQVTGDPDPVYPYLQQPPVEELPADVLPYLLSSRYCEVDRLTDV